MKSEHALLMGRTNRNISLVSTELIRITDLYLKRSFREETIKYHTSCMDVWVDG